MTPLQRLQLRQSEIREELGNLAEVEGDEATTQIETLRSEYRELEPRLQAALLAQGGDDPGQPTPDVARSELRARCSVGRFLDAALKGRSVEGAEAELAQEMGIDAGEIPFELWESEQRAITPPPSTGTGVNPMMWPAVFAPSVAPRLGIQMPSVESGAYSSGTLTTSLTASARTKGSAQTASAGAFTTTTTTPHSISCALELTREDLALVGTPSFETVLRQNVSLAMSDALDAAMLTGSGTDPAITGIIARLADPSDPSNVATWADFVNLAADQIDGLWASMESDVSLLLGPASYRLGCKTYVPQKTAGSGNGVSLEHGETSAMSALMARAGAVFTNNRMPAVSSDIQTLVAYKMGRPDFTTAVCPSWGRISIEDIYTGSRSNQITFSAHAMIGDVVLTQPGAYGRADLKVS